MKSTLFILACLLFVFAGTHYRKSPDGERVSPLVSSPREDRYQVLLSDGTHFILSIGGIANTPDSFKRPLNPEDCTIHLRTQDDREWRATWTPAH